MSRLEVRNATKYLDQLGTQVRVLEVSRVGDQSHEEMHDRQHVRSLDRLRSQQGRALTKVETRQHNLRFMWRGERV